MNDELILEKIKIGCAQRFSSALLDNMRLRVSRDSLEDFIGSQIAVHLTAYVYGKEIRIEVVDSVKYPSTWLEAMKERFAPEWLKRRSPVRYTSRDVVIKHIHICPHLNIKSDSDHLRFLSGDGRF